MVHKEFLHAFDRKARDLTKHNSKRKFGGNLKLWHGAGNQENSKTSPSNRCEMLLLFCRRGNKVTLQRIWVLPTPSQLSRPNQSHTFQYIFPFVPSDQNYLFLSLGDKMKNGFLKAKCLFGLSLVPVFELPCQSRVSRYTPTTKWISGLDEYRKWIFYIIAS